MTALFPAVSGYNLLRQKIQLPGGLVGQYNLVLIPFQQWQQAQVDTWVPALSELEQAFPGLAFYELPTIYKMNTLSRLFLNEGMRAGIPNHKTRSRTITLYLEKSEFRQRLGIASEDAITLLLLDRTGQILWRAAGSFEPEKAHDLAKTLTAYLQPAFETLWTRDL